MKKVFNYLRGDEYPDTSQLGQKSLGHLFESFKQFLKYLSTILKFLFPKFLCASTFLFLGLLIDVVALEFVVYRVGLFSGKYFKVLSGKDLDAFWPLALTSIAYITLNAFMKSIKDFISNLLSIVWRKYITLSLHELYFSNKNFYYLQHQSQFNSEENLVLKQNECNANNRRIQLNVQSTEPILNDLSETISSGQNFNIKKSILDNPDQRITQDVNSLCQSISSIIPLILISPFVIGWYGYQVEIRFKA